MSIYLFLLLLVIEHFVAAAHVEIGQPLKYFAVNHDITWLVPFSKFLCSRSEGTQFVLLFSMWFFTLIFFAVYNSILQRAADKAALEERLHQERVESVAHVKI